MENLERQAQKLRLIQNKNFYSHRPPAADKEAPYKQTLKPRSTTKPKLGPF